ncbi:ArsR/SmtB family transcription factor [Endozoicomonadaceae bacterium StTr2]
MAPKEKLDIQEMRSSAGEAVKLLKALSNENRLLILCHLGQQEMSVSELNNQLDLSQSALSQHLAVLRRDGLVATRRESQVIYYKLASREASLIIELLHREFCSQ